MAEQTPSERYLADLCRRSFLSLWSYPSLYTDEGKTTPNGAGRELSDLLVVFGDDVIIFSDKHIKFKDTGNVAVDWPRWYRRAILASIKQLYGAESWIRRFPNRIFIDQACTKPLPLHSIFSERTRFHHVAVTRGSYDACFAFFGGHSIGSLRISTDLGIHAAPGRPFTVGIGATDKPFVHILDEFTLDLLFEHLDTVSDFIAYLRKKERFLTVPGRTLSVDGEEQLLGVYISKMNEQEEHDFVFSDPIPPDTGFIHLSEGIWEEKSTSPLLRAKKEADKISYAWDHLIELFIRDGSARYLGIDIDQDPMDNEIALRVMAAEPRLNRRQVATALIDARERSGPTKAFARVCLSDTFPDTTYVFLADPKPPTETYERYRQVRVARLHAYCHAAILRTDKAKHIVGIAFDSKDPERRGGSEDLIYLDITDRTPELLARARDAQETFGILLPENVEETRYHGKEYPDNPGVGLQVVTDHLRARRKRDESRKGRKRRRAISAASRRRNRK